MVGLAADEVKNLLYILPVVSALICIVLVRHLRAKAERESAATPLGSGLELLGGAHALNIASHGDGSGGGSGDGDDQTPIQERHLAFVIEWDDEGIRAHAQKEDISDSVASIKLQVSELLTHAGLVAADSGLVRADIDPEARSSRAFFSGSLARATHAVRRLRDEMGWMRHVQGMDDVGVAYTVQMLKHTGRQRMHFEPCPLIFNANTAAA